MSVNDLEGKLCELKLKGAERWTNQSNSTSTTLSSSTSSSSIDALSDLAEQKMHERMLRSRAAYEKKRKKTTMLSFEVAEDGKLRLRPKRSETAKPMTSRPSRLESTDEKTKKTTKPEEKTLATKRRIEDDERRKKLLQIIGKQRKPLGLRLAREIRKHLKTMRKETAEEKMHRLATNRKIEEQKRRKKMLEAIAAKDVNDTSRLKPGCAGIGIPVFRPVVPQPEEDVEMD